MSKILIDRNSNHIIDIIRIEFLQVCVLNVRIYQIALVCYTHKTKREMFL